MMYRRRGVRFNLPAIVEDEFWKLPDNLNSWRNTLKKGFMVPTRRVG